MGTSLAVHPFASLIGEARPGTPRFLINRERVGECMDVPRGFDFESGADGHYEGDTDAAIGELCKLLGWEAELRAVLDKAPDPRKAR